MNEPTGEPDVRPRDSSKDSSHDNPDGSSHDGVSDRLSDRFVGAFDAADEPADDCHSTGSCVTCSDEAVPVTVVRLKYRDMAVVDTGDGEPEEVSVALVKTAVGDTILVHAKEAIAVITRVDDDGCR
jgi:hydrogenase expression/formation protein HypC